MFRFSIPLIFFFCPQPAWAYIDPGSISLLLQGFLAFIAGIVVAGNYWWARVSGFLRKIVNKRIKPDGEQ